MTRAEIEREMQKVVIHRADRCIDHVPSAAAVSVTERLLRDEFRRGWLACAAGAEIDDHEWRPEEPQDDTDK